jgi:hypothetical protein
LGVFRHRIFERNNMVFFLQNKAHFSATRGRCSNGSPLPFERPANTRR